MVFRNLFRPPHLSRFVLALIAGTLAIVIYMNAEHFKVVPATSALDDTLPAPPALGEYSVAVISVPGDCSEEIPPALALEVIRHLVRIPALEVIAFRSATALGALRESNDLRSRKPGKDRFDTHWLLRISCSLEKEDVRLTAALSPSAGGASRWAVKGNHGEDALQPFISEIVPGLADYFDLEMPGVVAPARQTQAYAKFLHARWLLESGAENVAQAENLLNEVLITEPDWAAALAARAYSHLLKPGTDPASAEVRIQAAKADLERAIELNPESPEGHLYRSIIAHRFDWDWGRAYEEAQAALRYAPGDAVVLAAASTAAFTLGHFDEGVEWLRRAIPLDPLILSHRLKYGLMLEFNGQPRAAIEAYRELKVRDPVYPGVHAYMGRALIVGDRIKLALPHMEIERNAFWRKYGIVLALYAMGREQEASEEFKKFIEQHGHEAAVQIAEIKAFSGSVDEAFKWLDRAINQRDPGVSELIGNPLLKNLVDDPRWTRLLNDLGHAGPGTREQIDTDY